MQNSSGHFSINNDTIDTTLLVIDNRKLHNIEIPTGILVLQGYSRPGMFSEVEVPKTCCGIPWLSGFHLTSTH